MHKSLIIRALAVVGACLFFSKNGAAQDCHLALHGRVTDADSHEPLAFVSIFLKETGRGAFTDEQGRYVLANLCPGAFTVVLSHLECVHFEQVVKLDESSVFDFALVHKDLQLGEVVVHEKAVELKKAQASSTVHEVDLLANQAKNLGETLKNLPGVTLLQTGATISKPVIQGLHSSRIVILTNGVPLEGQQWGSEHAPEIDPFSAGKITVVKGAAGVRYGAGAMGGVVVVEPPPLRDSTGLGGWLAVGGFSNGRSANASGALDFRLKNRAWPLAGRIQSTWKRAGNLRAPDYFLGNTGLAELDFSAALGLKKGSWTWEFVGSRFAQKTGILRASHIGNTTDLALALASDSIRNNVDEFSFEIDRPNQNVGHNLLKIKGLHRISSLWKSSFQYAFQFNRRQEFDRTRTSQSSRPSIQFDIFTNSLDLNLAHFPIKHWTGEAGFQAVSQQNQVYRGALLPDFWSLNGAVWAVERWRRYPSPLEYEVGVRYDYRWQNVQRAAVFKDTLDEILRFKNASATGGIIWRFSKNGSLTANSGLAWRPPHVNELYAAGVHHGAATFEQGRPDLKPERAWNSNLALEWAKNDRFRLSSTAFFNRIGDYIFLRPEKEFVLTVRGAFPKYSYQQTDAALFGGDLAIEMGLPGGFSFDSKASFLRGFRTGDSAVVSEKRPRDWLPLMPADRFQNGLKWSFSDGKRFKNGFARLSATSVLRQTRFDETLEFKAPPPAFTTVGLDAGAAFFIRKRKLDIGLSVSNLGNLNYREYLDFFRFYADSPGLNVGLRAKMTF